MNRHARRAELAVARREKRFSSSTSAAAARSGVPVDILKEMASGVARDALTELQPTRDDLPALAKTDPVRVTEFVGSYTDTWFSHEGGPAVACRAGCAHCCLIVPRRHY
jgi:hypothetical protein